MNEITNANGQIEAAAPKRKLRLRHDDYTVAWICPLPVEQTAALEMLDEEHDRLSQPRNDSNAYHLGSISGYNVVIAGLSTPGCSAAANVVAQMKMSFQNVKFGLLVGIGGGVPVRTDWGTVRLGDVVVGDRASGYPGTVQYDRGKVEVNGFKCTSSLPPPPPVLLAAVKALESQRDREREDPVWKNIQRIDTTKRGLVKYRYPGRDQDRLFKPTYIHLDSNYTCDECGCDPSERVQRPVDNEGDTRYVAVHRGNIATGEKVIKDAVERDQIAELYKPLCFETEAAGVFTDFHFLNIRGISDYCDSHKSNEWQGYAAAAAAAYARQLFFYLPLPETCNPKNISPPNKRQKISISEHATTKILKLLKFDQVDDRLMSIKTAHTETCGWLLKTPEYRDWLGSASDAPHHGFLWIKGKPGAGKSTLMKFIVEHAMEMKNRTVVSFFFHERGTALEKSVVGMYRSLLLQLFTKLPKLQEIFCSSKFDTWKTKNNIVWNIELLKDLFRDSVKSLEMSSVMCFIDALDECDVSQARDIVSFFHYLSGEFSVAQRINFRVCFASRHYPNISSPGHVELNLDCQAGHVNDIIRYIASELRIGKGNIANEIRDELGRKASGVFMWVVLVVEFLNIEHDEGCSARQLQTKLQAIPGDLHQLFRDILTSDKNKNEEFLLCMQWLLFAKRPLTPRELYLAIFSGTNLNSEDLREEGHTPIDTIMKFLLKCSKGLAEITKSKTPIMQFIHQSVRDFLAEDGLELLSPALKTNILGQSHERLKQCCLNYIGIDNSSPSERLRDLSPTEETFPFLVYAETSVLYHADVAEGAGISQEQFITNIRGDSWFQRTGSKLEKASVLFVLAHENLPNLIRIHPFNLSYLDTEDHRCHTPLSVAIDRGSHDAIKAFIEVQAKALPANPRTQALSRSLCESIDRSSPAPPPPPIHVGGFHGDYTLQRAARFSSPALLDFLLETGRWMPDRKDDDGRTLLSQAISLNVHREFIMLLLENPKVDLNLQDNLGRTPLSYAVVSEKNEKVAELLIQNPKVNPDTPDSTGRTPLSYAAGAGKNENVVELLLQNPKVNPDTSDSTGRTPLSYAATVWFDNESTVKYLLESQKVDPNSRDNSGRTPLSQAAVNGHINNIKQLLKDGRVGVDTKDHTSRTPLSHAVQHDRRDAIKLLLGTGRVDFDAKDHVGRTPLSYAAQYVRYNNIELQVGARAIYENGYMSQPKVAYAEHERRNTTQLLLGTESLDVDAKDHIDRTPLSYAAQYGHWKTIKLLLGTSKVDVDAKDHIGRTPLSYAAQYGHRYAIKLLLNTGKVDVDSKDDICRTPLSYAAQYGHFYVIELLLDIGRADVDVKDSTSRTPLSYAAQYGKHKVIRQLLSTGKVDIDSLDDDNMTPLKYAEQVRNTEILNLFVEVRKALSLNKLGRHMPENEEGQMVL